MIAKRTAYVFLLVLVLHCEGAARKRLYEQGKVVDFAPKYVDWPGVAIGPLPPLSPTRILIGYELQIQVGEDTYFVYAATCCPPSSFRGKLDWAVGDQVEFRADKGKMFVKPAGGGQELNARLLKIVTGIASPSLFTRSIGSAPRFAPVADTSRHEKLTLSPDFLRADDMCLMLFGNVGAGDFFDHIRSRKTANGLRYTKGSHAIKNFPESLVVSVIAVVGKCSTKELATPWEVAANGIHFDEHFMESIIFDGSWKEGLTEKPAELGPLAEGRIPNPVFVINDRDFSWEYQFKVKSEGVSLNNALGIILRSPDGKMVARFSARLTPKS